MRTKLFAVLSAVATVIILGCQLAVASEITMKMNNEPLELKDYEPVVVDDTPMLPIRATFELLGADTQWDAASKAIKGTKDNITITVFVGTDTYMINDLKAKMDAATIINDDGVGMASAKYLLRGFKYQMDWDAESKTLNILDWEHYNALLAQRRAMYTTTSATTTTVAATTTTVETTTETTTTLQQVLNSGPVFGTNKRMCDTMLKDIKATVYSYSLGNAEKNSRFSTNNVNALVKQWEAMAQTDLDKKYVKACATVYRTYISKMIALDKWTRSSTASDTHTRALKYKDAMTNYMLSLGKCDTIEAVDKLNSSLTSKGK